MYICYLDESGTPEPSANTNHFVLVGLAVPADTWKEKDQQVGETKAKYDLSQQEIHTAWMIRDYPEQKEVPNFDALPRPQRRKAVLGIRAMNLGRGRSRKQQAELLKNYKKTDAYVHLTRAERRACVTDLADLVGGWNDCRMFADAHDKAKTEGQRSFDIAFEQIVSRFQTYLSRAGNSYGLLVQDNNQTHARRLTQTMRNYHRTGTLWTRVDRLVETPLFVDSELTSMVQMADLCAYATRRFFERSETDLFDKIYGRFDRNNGILVGLRHFTGSFQCHCRVCYDHGRYNA